MARHREPPAPGTQHSMRLWFLSCLLCGHACAQLSGSVPSGTHLAARAIGPDDVIALTVYDAPELTRTFRVGEDGSLRLPMLRKSLPVEGLTVAGLEHRIATALREEKLLIDPIVTATVAEYHSRPIRVAGAVVAISPQEACRMVWRPQGDSNPRYRRERAMS